MSLNQQQVTTVAITAVVAAIVAWLTIPNVSITKKKLPGPLVIWPFGSGFEFLRYSALGKLHEYYEKAFKKYGSTFQLNIYGQTLVCTCDPDLVHRSLTNQDEFIRGDFFQKTCVGLLDHALFTLPSGPDWNHHRRILQPAFSPTQLQYAGDVTLHTMDEFISHFNHRIEKTPVVTVNLLTEFIAMTLDMIGLVVFSHSFHAAKSLHNNAENSDQAQIKDFMFVVQTRLGLSQSQWKAAGVDTESERVKGLKKYLVDLLYPVLERRMRSTENLHKSRDILGRMLESDSLSKDEILGEIIGFLVAGHESSANTLCYMVLELCKHPEVVKKLEEEIEEVLADSDATIDISNLHKFRYLDFVLKEAQRLHTVTGTLGRQSIKDIYINGCTVPANTTFQISLRCVHLKDEIWTTPKDFSPERWINHPDLTGSFAPFGGGPFKCIGFRMSTIFIKLVVIRLIQNFNMALVKDQVIEDATSLTTGLKYGLQVELTSK